MNQETYNYGQDYGEGYRDFDEGFVRSEQRHPGNESDNKEHGYQEFH
jgi:hypothetical protein